MAAEANLRQAVPFFLVADMAASLAFYVDGLGFRVGPEWRVEGELKWCWLSRGEVAFMLQQVPGEGATKGEGVSICVMCDDAIALYRELRGRGVAASRPFVGNGLWVTQVVDPDGFRLAFESPADAPEETEYRED